VSDFTQRHPTEPPDSPEDDEPDTLATPEGDNEYGDGEILPAVEPVAERPRGNEPHPSQPIRPAQE
jgi:hypothetical protein